LVSLRHYNQARENALSFPHERTQRGLETHIRLQCKVGSPNDAKAGALFSRKSQQTLHLTARDNEDTTNKPKLGNPSDSSGLDFLLFFFLSYFCCADKPSYLVLYQKELLSDNNTVYLLDMDEWWR
jgi:hypothetical protein